MGLNSSGRKRETERSIGASEEALLFHAVGEASAPPYYEAPTEWTATLGSGRIWQGWGCNIASWGSVAIPGAHQTCGWGCRRH